MRNRRVRGKGGARIPPAQAGLLGPEGGGQKWELAGDGPGLGRRGQRQKRANQGKGWGPGRQVGVRLGSELNRGRDLRKTGDCRSGAHSRTGEARRSHHQGDGHGSGIELRPSGPLTAGLNSGSPSPSLPSSVSRSRSNTAAMAAPAPRAPRPGPGWDLTAL